MIKLTPPKGQRMGQALYNFIYWLQDKYQMDTFNIPDSELPKVYKEWLDKQK
jgi:hypothetical protein